MDIKILSIAILMSLVSSSVRAIDITIEQGIENPIPIALAPFGKASAESATVSLSAVIAADLERSGRFQVMDFADLPQRPVELQDVNFEDWRLLGMENLVIGKLTQVDVNNYEIEFRLLDIYRRQQITGFHFSSTLDQLRMAAHEISDIVYEKLVGVRGAFATKIAYIAVDEADAGEKSYALYIADADGYNPRVLLKSTQPLMSPSWSPDGRRLAYVSFEGENSAIFIHNLETGKRDKVAANKGINSAPAWSPDGEYLAMTLSKDGNPEIYVMEIAAKTLRRITNSKAIDTEPNWSSDGEKLVFTSDRGGSPQIYQTDVNDIGKIKRLTFQGAYNARPRYSSDDSLIVMVTGENEVYRIAVLDLRNGFFNILTQSRFDESPSFSPNDHMIIYTTVDSRGIALAAVSTDGQVRQRLALRNSEVREPAWGPFLLKP